MYEGEYRASQLLGRLFHRQLDDARNDESLCSVFRSLPHRWLSQSECQRHPSALSSIGRVFPLRNRFPNVLPFDFNRVTLPSLQYNYVNASRVRGAQGEAYVLTQAPLRRQRRKDELTLGDPSVFWHLAMEEGATGLVTLTPFSDRLASSFSKLCPIRAGESRDFVVGRERQMLEVVRVQAVGVFWRGNLDNRWELRDLRVERRPLGDFRPAGPRVRRIRSVRYVGPSDWPSPAEFLEFYADAVAFLEDGDFEEKQRRLLVCCSDGVSHCGVFTLVDDCLRRLREQRAPYQLNLLEAVRRFRQQRMAFLPFAAMLRLCFEIVNFAAVKLHQANFDLTRIVITKQESVFWYSWMSAFREQYSPKNSRSASKPSLTGVK